MTRLGRTAGHGTYRAGPSNGTQGRQRLFRGPEGNLLQTLQLRADVGAFVEREPPADALRRTGRAVLDHRIGVHARARRVTPRAATPLPAGNHPPFAGPVLARGERG